MRRRWILVVAIIMVGTQVSGQNSTDKEQINRLCGCFEVDFRYAETFAPDPDYKFHQREETGGVAELALPIEVSDKKIVIQHLLIVSPTMIVKHWREEWTYENPVIWIYNGNQTWVKETVSPESVKGKWTQTVWEVSDAPRYQGFSQFVNLDGKMTWQSTADAPLPRREYSVRNDYDILRRTNRLRFTDSGYVHEQDNQKIIRSGATDKLLAEEKGWNTYKRIEEKECSVAKEYWEKNKDYWTQVRKVWDDYVATHDRISLENKVEGKMLHEYLMDLSNDYAAGKINKGEIAPRIRSAIARFDNGARKQSS